MFIRSECVMEPKFLHEQETGAIGERIAVIVVFQEKVPRFAEAFFVDKKKRQHFRTFQ